MRKINKYKFSGIATTNHTVIAIMLLFSLSILAQGAAALPMVFKTETIGSVENGHTYSIHIYNVDDVAEAIVNGNVIGPYNAGSDVVIDITTDLAQGSGNTISFYTTNNVGGWTYGFDLLKDSIPIWSDTCGIFTVDGCMGNDQHLGPVYQSVLILPAQAPLFSFVRGGDNGLWYKTYDGKSWSNWVSLGGFLTSDPDSAKLNGDTYVFVRGGDNGLWYQKYNSVSNSWEGWISLGGVVTSGPGAS